MGGHCSKTASQQQATALDAQLSINKKLYHTASIISDDDWDAISAISNGGIHSGCEARAKLRAANATRRADSEPRRTLLAAQQQSHANALALMPDSRRLGPPPRKEITLSLPDHREEQGTPPFPPRVPRTASSPPPSARFNPLFVDAGSKDQQHMAYGTPPSTRDYRYTNKQQQQPAPEATENNTFFVEAFGSVKPSDDGSRIQWTCDFAQLLRAFEEEARVTSAMEVDTRKSPSPRGGGNNNNAFNNQRLPFSSRESDHGEGAARTPPLLCPSMPTNELAMDAEGEYLPRKAPVARSSPFPTSIASPVFYAECNRRFWQLFLAPCDFDASSVSLYLKCCGKLTSDSEVSDELGACGEDTTFFLCATSRGVNGARGHRASLTPTTVCILPTLEYELTHAFPRGDDAWGVQEFITLERPHTTPSVDKGGAAALCSATNVIDFMLAFAPPGAKCDAPLARSVALDEDMEITVLSYSPHIVQIENFMSQEETDAFIRLAEPDLKRSRVANGQETPSRTSWSIFLTGKRESDPIVVALEEKIQRLLARPVFHQHRTEARKAAAAAAATRRGGGVDAGGPHRAGGLTSSSNPPSIHTSLHKSEALQVVRYRTGEYYHEHYDNRAGNAAHRAATFMVYLSDVEAGGATYFSKGTPVSCAAAGGEGAPEAAAAFSRSQQPSTSSLGTVLK